jgi:hypothetical protein
MYKINLLKECEIYPFGPPSMCISVLLCAWICFVDENETIKIKIHDIYDFAFILEYFGHGRLASYGFLSSIVAPVVKILGNVS